MKKIVINSCYGGFGLSPEATERYAEKKGRKCFFFEVLLSGGYKRIDKIEALKTFIWCACDIENPPELYAENKKHRLPTDRDIDRSDPDLVSVVETLGDRANGKYAKLKVVGIPDGVEWEIEEYDGVEWVSEKHRTWR